MNTSDLHQFLDACSAFAEAAMQIKYSIPGPQQCLRRVPEDISTDRDDWPADRPLDPLVTWIERRFAAVEPAFRECGWDRIDEPLVRFAGQLQVAYRVNQLRWADAAEGDSIETLPDDEQLAEIWQECELVEAISRRCERDLERGKRGRRPQYDREGIRKALEAGILSDKQIREKFNYKGSDRAWRQYKSDLMRNVS